MFWDKKERCKNCGSEANKNWEFCPNCGKELSEKAKPQRAENPFAAFSNIGGFGGFEQIFQQMEKQIVEMDRAFAESPREMMRQPKGFKIVNPRGGGISISIIQAGSRPPQINVKTSGEFRQMEPDIKRELGAAVEAPVSSRARQPALAFENKLSAIKETAEPETEIKKINGQISYTINLPDVKKADDIQIKRLPNSIEIRAVCGNKMYFKLFEAPQNLGIVERSFRAGVLNIVLG